MVQHPQPSKRETAFGITRAIAIRRSIRNAPLGLSITDWRNGQPLGRVFADVGGDLKIMRAAVDAAKNPHLVERAKIGVIQNVTGVEVAVFVDPGTFGANVLSLGRVRGDHVIGVMRLTAKDVDALEAVLDEIGVARRQTEEARREKRK